MGKKYVILGNFLGKNIVGLIRLGYEYLLQIDEFATEFDIELLLPRGFSEYAKDIKNIKIVERGEASSKWTTIVATQYIKETGRIMINLAFSFSLNKHSIVQIADVRYMEKYEGQYFDSLSFRLPMTMRSFIGAKHADYVMTISQFSKERIKSLLKVPEEKIFVIPCGWEHIARMEADYNIFHKYPQLLENRYFFTLGSLARHKNHKLIMRMAKNNPDNYFVIGGGVDSQIFYEDCTIDNMANLVFTGRLTDGEIKALYKKCAAFIFPSLYEGFGIPPLEALACGTQAIVSNIPVMREVFGDAVHYIEPDDDRVKLNELLTQQVTASSKLLKTYSWENAGRKWYEFFKGLDGDKE